MTVRRFHQEYPGKVSHILWEEPECPMCTSIEGRRSPPRFVDVTPQLSNLIPLQCTNCWRYFYWMRDDKAFVSQTKTSEWVN